MYIKYIDNYQKMEIEKLIEYKKRKQKTQIKNTTKNNYNIKLYRIIKGERNGRTYTKSQRRR